MGIYSPKLTNAYKKSLNNVHDDTFRAVIFREESETFL